MPQVTGALQDWVEDTKKNANTIVLLGVLTSVCGFFSLVLPWIAGLSVSMLIGFVFVLGGIARLIASFSAGSFGRGTIAFIGAALTVIVGVILVTRPGFGLAALTMILGVYLMMDGIFGALLAFQLRPETGWGSILFSAVLSVVMSVMLLTEWPIDGIWAIGTLVGINLLFAGFSLISIGSSAKKQAKELT